MKLIYKNNPLTTLRKKKIKQTLHMPREYQVCEATKFYDKRQMKVVRLSALCNCTIYTPGDIFVTQLRYRLSRPPGLVWPVGLCQWKFPRIIGNGTRDIPACSCHTVCRFLSILCYQSFVHFGVTALCSNFSV